jgi:hypothetical protein
MRLIASKKAERKAEDLFPGLRRKKHAGTKGIPIIESHCASR